MAEGVVFEDYSDDVRRLLEGATAASARVIAGKIRNYARAATSKAKGPMGNPWPTDVIIALRDSITEDVEEMDAGQMISVGTNMQIGPYIELGTGKEYDPPDEWLEYHGDDGHTKGGLDSWLYKDKLEGVTKVGKPVPPTPYLRPAVLDHASEYKDIVEDGLKNA